ncbi:MAG: Sua5/YciO/YrdC/YwlC family protein, partial [bacterium]
VSREEEEILLDLKRPIVLLQKRDNYDLSRFVAPGINKIGAMLPYTPIHYMLLDDGFEALVATSANRSDQPIVADIDEARKELSDITEHFLDHDRDIFMRIDDSVTQTIKVDESVLRRARGYVPMPIVLKGKVKEVLAVGGELKNTICLTKGEYAFISQHIGDLKGTYSMFHFQRVIQHFMKLNKINPQVIAHDLHPDYLSTQFAREQDISAIIPVQHHHAHIVSCMTENGLREPVIGVCFDGLGYGSDGRMWGGEFMISGLSDFERVGHFKNIGMPGGDAASREPYRMALSYLYTVFGKEVWNMRSIPVIGEVEAEKKEVVLQMIEKNINCPETSSVGRLFDAVSSILGICHIQTYEGQAPMELEAKTRNIPIKYHFHVLEEGDKLIVDPTLIIQEMVRDLNAGMGIVEISTRFHNTIAWIVAYMAEEIKNSYNLDKVVLSGGVFQNKYLTERTLEYLDKFGFSAYIHHKVPCNDGGISLGQAIIANERIK